MSCHVQRQSDGLKTTAGPFVRGEKVFDLNVADGLEQLSHRALSHGPRCDLRLVCQVLWHCGDTGVKVMTLCSFGLTVSSMYIRPGQIMMHIVTISS